jgi:hypothetical protein
VSEDPSFTRDFGVDESSQVSLSNAYNLNRGIDHEKAVAVIKTYQRIRREMPAESVGEWYHIYPPFERGWHIPKWDYTNGGLKTIVAGELAHGAFEHGFEAYGADILQRVHDIGAAHADRLFYGFTGGIIPRPKTNFQKLDLSGVANLEYRSRVTRDAVAWCDEDALGLDGFPAGTFDADGVPFDLIDPEQHNGRGGVALCHSAESALPVDEPGTAQSKAQDAAGPAGPAGPADNAPAGPSAGAALDAAGAAPDAEAGSTSPTGPNAGSAPYEELTLAPMSRVHALYLLHACDVKEPGVAGEVEFRYADGGSARRLVLAGRDVLRWMQQRLPEPRSFFVNHGEYRNPIIAWQGRNRKYPTVVVTATGINNPHPERDLAGIVLRSSPEGARWNVLAATVADQPAFFPMKDHSAGAPANWGAGALTYALMEGLVGVVDTDRNYESATVSPRWDAAGVSRVTATAKYAEGGGYVSYSLRRSASTLELDVAASGPRRRIRILLPAGTTPGALYVNGEEANYETETVEDSTYACFSHDGVDSIRARLTVS